jgi:hypothetical protein
MSASPRLQIQLQLLCTLHMSVAVTNAVAARLDWGRSIEGMLIGCVVHAG